MAASAARVHTRIQSTAVVVLDPQACRGCGSCIAVCPVGALDFADGFNAAGYTHAQVTAPEACMGEGHCLYVCPEGAIHLEATHVLRSV
jgi:ferredoxin